jgi:hypothetical protein
MPLGAEDSRSKTGVGSEVAWVGAMLHGERVWGILDAGLVRLFGGPSTGATRSAFLQCVTSVPQASAHTVVGETQATGSEGHDV